MQSNISRRTFIKGTTAISIHAAMVLTGCGVTVTKNTQDQQPNPNVSKPKALVYLMLNGGNDSFNMLVPTSTAAYNEYATTRSNLKIAQANLKPLNGFTDKNNKTFGLHPAMPKTQALFNDKKLAFVANVGTLVQPTTKAQFLANSVSLPLGMMSHSDQRKHWQTSTPNKRTNIGVFGRLSDEFQANKADTQISMNISLGGTNILQNGVSSQEYSVTKTGSVGLKVKETVTAVTHPSYTPAQRTGLQNLNNALLDTYNTILNKSYSESFEKTFIGTTKFAQTHHETFKAKTNSINPTTFVDYSSKTTHTNGTKYSAIDKDINDQFKMIAKAIKASEDLNMEKQTFYIDYYGWDHHDELTNNHERMLSVIDDALDGFQKALIELDIEDKVMTIVGSDFGRTLTSNGNGTDHAWGGNAIVMGKDINGGKIYGEYPSLALNSSLDIGGGVLVPTTSTDELFAEILYWFGVEKNKLSSYLPNLEKFYSTSSATLPIGFLK
jgi:uncharacterized protein (DUF1501 family)